MPRSKLPALPILARHQHQAELDRRAIAAVGKPFTVPAFCREMARLLREESIIPPWGLRP